MTKKKHHIIKLSDTYSEMIASRAAIINLFSTILTDVNSIEIDFKRISFVSRAAVHQLIKEKENLQKNDNIEVVFSNLNRTVKEMFDAVEKSIKTPKKDINKIKKVQFNTDQEFYDFLLSR